LTFNSSRPFAPFNAAARLRWAVISMPVLNAVTRPSPITLAGTGTVRSAKRRRVNIVPHELNVLALDNPRMFYDLLFTASAQTLLKVARDPKHLGAEIGVISILHTWGQNLLLNHHS
jgi:hypothetical protein